MEKHVVRLTEEERKKLSDLISKGRGPAAALRRARILLKADDPKRPVVCFDELSKQLVKETREPILAETGRKERFDYGRNRIERSQWPVAEDGAHRFGLSGAEKCKIWNTVGTPPSQIFPLWGLTRNDRVSLLSRISVSKDTSLETAPFEFFSTTARTRIIPTNLAWISYEPFME